MPMDTFEKHPQAVLDYGYDLTRWLTGTEQVTTVTGTLLSGDVVVGQGLTDGKKMGVMITGGTNKTSSTVRIVGQTNSNPPRTFARTIQVFVTDSIGQQRN